MVTARRSLARPAKTPWERRRRAEGSAVGAARFLYSLHIQRMQSSNLAWVSDSAHAMQQSSSTHQSGVSSASVLGAVVVVAGAAVGGVGLAHPAATTATSTACLIQPSYPGGVAARSTSERDLNTDARTTTVASRHARVPRRRRCRAGATRGCDAPLDVEVPPPWGSSGFGEVQMLHTWADMNAHTLALLGVVTLSFNMVACVEYADDQPLDQVDGGALPESTCTAQVLIAFYDDAECTNQVGARVYDTSQTCFAFTARDTPAGASSATRFQCYRDRLCYTQFYSSDSCSDGGRGSTDNQAKLGECTKEAAGTRYAKLISGTEDCPEAPAGFECPASAAGEGADQPAACLAP